MLVKGAPEVQTGSNLDLSFSLFSQWSHSSSFIACAPGKMHYFVQNTIHNQQNKPKWTHWSNTFPLECNNHTVNFTDAIVSEGVQPMQEFLTSLGGWPMIEASWSDASFNLGAFMAAVVRNGGVILHDFLISPEPTDNTKYNLWVSRISNCFHHNDVMIWQRVPHQWSFGKQSTRVCGINSRGINYIS